MCGGLEPLAAMEMRGPPGHRADSALPERRLRAAGGAVVFNNLQQRLDFMGSSDWFFQERGHDALSHSCFC